MVIESKKHRDNDKTTCARDRKLHSGKYMDEMDASSMLARSGSPNQSSGPGGGSVSPSKASTAKIRPGKNQGLCRNQNHPVLASRPKTVRRQKGLTAYQETFPD